MRDDLLSITAAFCSCFILSALLRLPYLNKREFPSMFEERTIGIVRHYEQGTEYTLTEPPLSYFIYFFLHSGFFDDPCFMRFVPAILSLLIPLLFFASLYYSGVSLANSFAAAWFLTFECSFSWTGRELAKYGLFDFFSVLAFGCTNAIAIKKSEILLMLEALFVSLCVCTDATGLVILIQILVAEALRKRGVLYLQRVKWLVGVVPISFLAITFHISMVSGPSDVYLFRTRFYRALMSILFASEREDVNMCISRMNIVFLFAVIGIILSLMDKKYDMPIGFGLSLLATALPRACFVLKIHLMLLYGVAAFCEQLDRRDSHRLKKWTMTAVVVSTVIFLVQFERTYEGKVCLPCM